MKATHRSQAGQPALYGEQGEDDQDSATTRPQKGEGCVTAEENGDKERGRGGHDGRSDR